MTKLVCKIPRWNSKPFLRKPQKILGGYFILPHPVYWVINSCLKTNYKFQLPLYRRLNSDNKKVSDSFEEESCKENNFRRIRRSFLCAAIDVTCTHRVDGFPPFCTRYKLDPSRNCRGKFAWGSMAVDHNVNTLTAYCLHEQTVGRFIYEVS